MTAVRPTNGVVAAPRAGDLLRFLALRETAFALPSAWSP